MAAKRTRQDQIQDDMARSASSHIDQNDYSSDLDMFGDSGGVTPLLGNPSSEYESIIRNMYQNSDSVFVSFEAGNSFKTVEAKSIKCTSVGLLIDNVEGLVFVVWECLVCISESPLFS